MANTKIIVIPDTHAPYHDKRALYLAKRACEELKPDVIVFIGDFADCYAASSHRKDPRRLARLKPELTEARAQLQCFRGLADELHFTKGNHEDRIERFLTDKAPELFGLVSSKELLGCDTPDWHWHECDEILKIGKVAFAHEIGHFGKYTANASLETYGGNIVVGHSHRAGIVYGGNMRNERHFAMNVGWLGDIKAVNYMKRPQTRNWQLGIGYIEMDPRGNAWASFCPIVKRKVVVGGVTVV